jgi:hypothetical protein
MKAIKRKYSFILFSVAISILMFSTAVAVPQTQSKNIANREIHIASYDSINIDKKSEILSESLLGILLLGTCIGVILSGLTIATTPFSWPIWGILFAKEIWEADNAGPKVPTLEPIDLLISFMIGTLLAPLLAFQYGYNLADNILK